MFFSFLEDNVVGSVDSDQKTLKNEQEEIFYGNDEKEQEKKVRIVFYVDKSIS